jgi:hypothetical protein
MDGLLVALGSLVRKGLIPRTLRGGGPLMRHCRVGPRWLKPKALADPS